MTKLEKAQEILRLKQLLGVLLTETAEALKTALRDPGDSKLVKEAELKLAECQLVNREFKRKIEEWQTN